MDEPYLGAIVHYINSRGSELAAIVVNVHPHGVVDLFVFPVSPVELSLKASNVQPSLNKKPHTWHWAR